MSKTALITGVTGQDGAYLARLLLAKGYVVAGVKRRSSSFNSARVDDLYVDPHETSARFFMHYGDLTDSTNLIRIVQETQPDEIYNLAAQSHVAVSFETPEYTANADAVGTLRLLEAIRILGMAEKVRFYQASTSELYGKVQEVPQRETTPFYPRSPYGVAKLYAYWITVNYREAYGMHASNGILFNHEGPTRGETFVTRKITRAVAAIQLGLQEVGYVEVRMTAVRSHFTPDLIRVKQGDLVSLHITNLEQAEDVTHGLAIAFQDFHLNLQPGEHANLLFRAREAGVFPFYSTEAASVLHEEMAGYLLVEPRAAAAP